MGEQRDAPQPVADEWLVRRLLADLEQVAARQEAGLPRVGSYRRGRDVVVHVVREGEATYRVIRYQLVAFDWDVVIEADAVSAEGAFRALEATLGERMPYS